MSYRKTISLIKIYIVALTELSYLFAEFQPRDCKIVILFLLYILDILQKIKRSVIIEKTVRLNCQIKCNS